MNCFVKRVLCLGAAILGTLIFSLSDAKHGHTNATPTIPSSFKESLNRSKHRTTFKHSMQLYLADAYGIEVPGSEFWITIDVIKEKINNNATRVTLQLPSISFETGPFANNQYETANPISAIIDKVPGLFLPPPQNGGYLYTKDGFLPSDLRPTEVLPRTYFGPSNNGQNIPFIYVANPNPPPNVSNVIYQTPQPGYQIQVTHSGGLVIQGIGTLGNIIPPGTQQLLATDLTYIVKHQKSHICKNTRISTGAINIAQYTLPPPTTGNIDNVRDHHVNDAYDNVVAFAWADNSNIPNAAANPGAMNLAYAIGKVKEGKLKMRKARFLPTPENLFVWDTAIAINRQDKNNIVISYLLIDANSPTNGLPYSILCAAVSYDGGKTWPINGPTNIQPTGFIAPGIPGGAGDNPGVRADKFGNFWYMATNFFDDNGNEINQPFIMASRDKGATWELVYTFTYNDVSHVDFYDYPAFCFGGDGLGHYGVQMIVDFFPRAHIEQSNGYPSRAFIPVTGLGEWGTPQQVFLPQLSNNIFVASITASEDGKVWMYGSAAGLDPAQYCFPGGFTNNRLVFKSPGQLDENYAGPWGVIRYNTLSESIYYPVWKAAPLFGFFQSVQTNLYDEKRGALYVILSATYPELSNNSEIYFLISGDNGLTWSKPFKINTKRKNNRGFPSMALDTKTHHLVLGWYDCRDYKDGLSFNYWGGVIDAKTLDKLVKQIPKSNPLFSVPPTGFDVLPTAAQTVGKEKSLPL
jgi:hypothetical protein